MVGSPFQFLNFIEFKNLNLKNKKIFKNELVFIKCNSRQEARYILDINKKINSNKNEILNLNENIPNFLLLFILKIKKLLFYFDVIIIGDFNNYIFKQFYKLSKHRIILDDGTNMFNFKKNFNLDYKNLKIFSIFERNFFNHKNFEKNELRFLKSKLSNKNKKNLIYILGSPAVEKKIITRNNYIEILKRIKKKHKSEKIIYIPHPKEHNNQLKNYKLFNILNIHQPIELYLTLNDYYPKKIIGFNSTAFFSLRKLFNKKIKFVNYSFQFPLKEKTFFENLSKYLINKLEIQNIKIC